MSNRYIEKSFVYLLVISLLLHIAGLGFLYYLPAKQPPAPKEPVFVDLQQMPELKPTIEKPQQKEVPRLSEQRRQVERETAPRGQDFREQPAVAPIHQAVKPQQQVQPRKAATATATATAPGAAPATNQPTLPKPVERRDIPVAPGSSVASLLKPKQQSSTRQPSQQATQQLFPLSEKMAKLERNYRRKLEEDVAEGDDRILNANSTNLISFFRRVENAIYGVWRIPPGGEGLTGAYSVLVTLNARTGAITRIKILESAGPRILEDEVIRVLNSIGPLGPLPSGYQLPEYDTFMLFTYNQNYKRILR